jgi:nitroreductase
MTTGTIEDVALIPATIKTIYERRAVRKYQHKPVDRILIEKIIDAGRMAPSALNAQEWKFCVVTNPVTIQSFSKAIDKIAAKQFIRSGPKQMIKNIIHLLHFSQGFRFLKVADHVFYEAPVVIFIAAPRDNEWVALDVGMCAQNMMLAAKSLGLDSCPVGFGKYIEHTKFYPELHIPSSEEIQLSVIFGYGDETPELHPRKKNNVLYID